ncbi:MULTISPECIES: hypothetical protein [unclassified Fibrobacter]|uniref:hypothetical protein n=1 Tax=unclassified Fibrobacter TaxID=2634177 RepID=UPI000D6B94B6|nr:MULTISPECIES: hypothetical protein [unclassified Fibrobacter]PWJ71829.1 hypothetical protein BGX12_10165 [Fibrobacter sp. UWR4]PZW73744.1 hypothetical protein C8E88_100265 [Fibrobacter sp. UWR1]
MLKSTLLACGVLASISLGQDIAHCTHQVANTPLTVKFKGDYINAKKNNVSVDVEWHHNPAAQDTFYIIATGTEAQMFVTAGEHRYVIYGKTKAKRQIGARHLRENIGETPMKYDDLELLANGWFLHPDSANVPNVILSAFPETQAEFTLDTLPYPMNISVKRWNDDRSYEITEWKEFSGAMLPANTKITGKNFSGNIVFY